ncbi:MAG TPA: hypothetical protein VKE96_12470 [Vicinamibacterales bacterium]|nr:hypothetical protein [Vicinamibacterales bacterium]
MASTGTYAPDPDLHVVDANNQPVSGGLVWTYIAGTTTPIATYADVGLTTPNTNPIVAGSDGRFVAFLNPGNSYKFIYETAATPPAHGSVLATRDNITAMPVYASTTDVIGTAGQTLTAGQVAYLSFGGQWLLADADDAGASYRPYLIGVAVNTAVGGTQCLIRISGQIAIPGVTLIPGTMYYISQTSGAITSTVPPPPAYARFLGQALDATTLALGLNPQEPQGVVVAQAFNAGHFVGGGSMTWTVTSGQMNLNQYAVFGRTLMWTLHVNPSTLGGTSSALLLITLPGGFSSPGASASGLIPTAFLLDGGATPRSGYVGLWSATQVGVINSAGVLALGANAGVGFTIFLPIL